MGASGPRPGNREYIHSWASLRSLVLISRAIFGLHQVLAVQTSSHLTCVTWPHYFTVHTFKRNLSD